MRGFNMTSEQERKYGEVEELKEEIEKLRGRKFRLDCGHHVTFGHHLGSDIMIYNGKKYKIYCSLCCY
jgi:hypothetical protein